MLNGTIDLNLDLDELKKWLSSKNKFKHDK